MNPIIDGRPILGFTAYRVTPDGQVWTCWKRGKIGKGTNVMGEVFRPLKLRVYNHKSSPYFLVALYPGDGEKPSVRTIHKIVLEAFVGPCPKGMLCRHGDDNPLNNNVSNLSWGTPKENQHDRRRNGTTSEGMKHAGAKLSDDQVREMRRIYSEGGIYQRPLAKMFGISQGHLTRILTRKKWAHIL